MTNLPHSSVRFYKACLITTITFTCLYFGIFTFASGEYVFGRPFDFSEQSSEMSFIHRPPCKGNLLSILITSSIDNVDRRRVIRETWARDRPVRFLLGQPVDAIQQTAVDEEAIKYGDIVQGAFIDSYRNLTHKSIMGLLYARDMCRSSFTYKIDDDTYVHIDRLQDYLKNNPKNIQCKVQRNLHVARHAGSKWYVNWKEYAGPVYPDYCWGGFGAIMSAEAIRVLLNQIPSARFFWIEDVFITGILRDMSQMIISDIPAQHLTLTLAQYQAMKNRSAVIVGPAELKDDELIQVRNLILNDTSSGILG